MNQCIASVKLQQKIRTTIKGFRKTWQSEEAIYEEFCFCLLTPQSSAKQAMKCIKLLKENNLLHKGNAAQKEKFVKNVRFFRTKSKRLEEAQYNFPASKIKKILKENGLPSNAKKCREFLVKKVNGYGMKEASHFLRNIGFMDRVAILDRHILKNLVRCSVIEEVPKTLTIKNYLEIEEKMVEFCKENRIDFAELDLIFWSNETGEVLK
jgi:N-glycosylase/DNA lyase